MKEYELFDDNFFKLFKLATKVVLLEDKELFKELGKR